MGINSGGSVVNCARARILSIPRNTFQSRKSTCKFNKHLFFEKQSLNKLKIKLQSFMIRTIKIRAKVKLCAIGLLPITML